MESRPEVTMSWIFPREATTDAAAFETYLRDERRADPSALPCTCPTHACDGNCEHCSEFGTCSPTVLPER
jgi:hypothetical protein